MSDGRHDATRGGRRRTAVEPSSGSAPWERCFGREPDEGTHSWQLDASIERDHQPPTESLAGHDEHAGGHSDGALSVADLLAKVGGPKKPGHRRAARHADPGQGNLNLLDRPLDLQDTQIIDRPVFSSDVVSEIPDLRTDWTVEAAVPADVDDEIPPAAEDPSDSRAESKAPTAPHDLERKHQKGTLHRAMVWGTRSIAALLALLSLSLTGGAWHWSNSMNAHMNTVSALDQDSRDIVDPSGQYGDEDFLIVGMDSRAGGNSNMGAGDTDDADGVRSDTVMLVNIPANRKRVVAVSFPRDLAITPMQCEAWNPDTGKYGPVYDQKTKQFGPKMVTTETKLNSTFAYGGPKCLVKEIQKLSGLSINRFIAIDFVGFARMVEALGGVEVCSSTPLQDYELGTVLEHAGRQRIDGPTALNYVRARQVTTEYNGDYGRIKRQQLFLSSLLRSLISEDTLFSLNKLNNVVNMFINSSYVDNVQTKDLVQLGQSLQGMAAGHITFMTVPTGVTDQNGDEPPRTADVKALFGAIINDEPLPEENDRNALSLGTNPKAGTPTSKTQAPESAAPSPQRQQLTTMAPQDVTVQVYNATGQSGLAATATSQLKKNGFNVMSPGDYSSSVKATTVLFSPGNEQAAATVAAAFPNSKVERTTSVGKAVQVVLGPDFSAVTAPPPSGSSMSMQIDRNTSSPATRLPDDLTVTNAADTTCG